MYSFTKIWFPVHGFLLVNFLIRSGSGQSIPVPGPGLTAGLNRASPVTVTIEPRIPMTKCSGEDQLIICQLVDYEGELPKLMKKAQRDSGYGGYLEFLLFKKTKTKQHVVTDIHVNYPQDILSPKSMPLQNVTIFDKGEYNCTVIWHAINGDMRWTSEPLQLNVYDCIHLEEDQLQVKEGDSVTMQCIDVEAPIKWFKDDDLLDESPTDPSLAKAAGGAVPGIRTITVNSYDDAGIYTCKAMFEDTQQIFTKNTKVYLKSAPTTSINITPTSLSPTTAILSWTQKPVANQYVVAEPTFYTIFYKPLLGETFLSKTVLKNPQVMLTNLKASTVYFVRIQAENELGTSVSGSRIVVTPAASQTVTIDKRLLTIMNTQVKGLTQDLSSISKVLKDIVPEQTAEDSQEEEMDRTRRFV